MDIIDVNEAFASQFLAVQKELDLPIERTVRSPSLALSLPSFFRLSSN